MTNGLERIELHSETNEIGAEEIETALSDNFGEKTFVVAYLDYKVLIGTWENNAFHFYENEQPDLKYIQKYIQKMRVFNTDKELLVWRTNGRLKGRLRTDENGTETEVVVTHQVLFGTRKGSYCNNNFTEITENRGTSLILPFADLTVDDKRNRIRVRTHNYIGHNTLGQATYEDCRFVSFCDVEKDLV